MGKLIDLTNKRYGRLLVIKRVDIKPRKGRSKTTGWLCVCDCKKEKSLSTHSLTSGAVRSCGCYRRDNATKLATTHGNSGHKLNSIWRGMKNRCYNKNYHGYHRYGLRGIEVCEEWLKSYKVFHGWAILNNYEEGKELDRINNDGGYSPNTCRFVNRTENIRNSTASKLTIDDACEIRRRLKNGCSCKDIAKDYPVGASAISCIKNNRVWK
ncbi:MAG: hypothetical protein PF495_10050 [Spirochaetales bacterium]|jgi:hypothetical protein|nr:hypothetical protein [Spirochaetales bacterium]